MQNHSDRNKQSFMVNPLHDVLDNVPLAVHLFDNDANLLYCNQAAASLCAIDNKQEYMDNFHSFIPFIQPTGRRSREALREFVAETLRTGSMRQTFVFQNSDGMLIRTGVDFSPIKYGRKMAVVSYSTELDPEIQKKEQESDLRASLMMDSMPLACFLVDRDFMALDCNIEALHLFGLSNKEDAISQLDNIFPDTSKKNADNVRTAVHRALATGRYNFELTCYTVTGEPIPCECTLVRVYYQRNHVVAVYIRDLREMKAVIDEIKRIEVAEQESHAKSRFLAQMSHEIRTPMNAILGVAEIQLLGGSHPPDIEEAFMQIYTSSTLLLGIINDILDLSKVAAEKMSIVPARYEMSSLIVDTVQLNLMYVGDKTISLELKVDEMAPFALIGDELRIKQVLNNLLSNAFKYTKEGTVALSIDVEPTDDPQQVIVIFSVRDTGQGMDQKQLDSLFVEEYVRHNEAGNRNIQGTGLGLSITQRLVHMMDGEITVESELGRGSVFTVRLPQQRDGDEVLGAETSKNLENLNISKRSLNNMRTFVRDQMPYGRVLVIDDAETNLYVAKGQLMLYGLNISTGTSGQEAIDRVKNGEVYDIIFMDHMMPDMDGMETTKIIRDMGYEHPIVAYTANVLAGQAEFFLENGFSDFLSKPVDVRQLNDCLVRFILNKQSPELIEAVKRYKAYEPPQPKAVSAGLLESFLRDAVKAVDILETITAGQSFDADNIKLYTVCVHSLKSALANIGELVLSKEAYTLEHAGRSMDIETISAKTPAFTAQIKEIIAKHKPAEEPEGNDSPDSASDDIQSRIQDRIQNEDPYFTRNKLLNIQKACERFDMFAAKQNLNELSQQSPGKDVKALISKIDELILHSEIDDVVELINHYINNSLKG